MNLGGNPMSFSTSSASWKSGDGVSDKFPAGLRVLVVDDDPTCLRILEKMLKICLYEVTKCSRAEVALKLLRDNKDGFDIVLSDVHMPDMDGFKLLEHIGLEMDLPVIMMSADDSKNVVMKGVTHGACDYLIKPVRMEALRNIWQHVVRKKKYEWNEKDNEQSGSVEDGEQNQKPQSEDVDYSSSANEGHNWKSSRKRKDEEDDGDERDDTSNLKKPRVVWSAELHQQFVAAVNQLGIDKAVPKKILELMNVPGLTRENVASHLQKYRLYLKRISGQHHGMLGNAFMCPTDPAFGSITPLNGLDFQALASSSQLPPQSLATIQAAALSRAPSFRPAIPISVPQVDQRNIFSFENPRIRFGEGQQEYNNNRQVNLLHGIPTNMDTKQLAALHQSAQPFVNVNLPIHPPPSTQILSQPIFSQAIPSTSTVSGRNGMDNVRGQTYASVSQPSVLVDFSRSQHTDMQRNNNNNSSNNSFSLMGNGAIASTSSYDVFRNNSRTEEWGLSGFDVTQNTSTQVAPSVLVQSSGFSSEPRYGQSRMPSVNNRATFLSGEGIGSSNTTNPGLVNCSNTSRIRPERLPVTGFQNGLFPDQFDQEDLMSALLRQQEGVGPGENDFGFEGYHLDNLPV